MSNQNVFSRNYWRLAAGELKNTKSLVFASFIIVLRIVVKAFKIPLAAGLSLTFDCYVNSLGSLIYGPVVGLCVGAVSDTLGYAMLHKVAWQRHTYHYWHRDEQIGRASCRERVCLSV